MLTTNYKFKMPIKKKYLLLMSKWSEMCFVTQTESSTAYVLCEKRCMWKKWKYLSFVNEKSMKTDIEYYSTFAVSLVIKQDNTVCMYSYIPVILFLLDSKSIKCIYFA